MMRAKFQTFKSNRDGSMTLFFEKGLDKHLLIDMEGQEVQVVASEGVEISGYTQVQIIMRQIDSLIEQIKKEK
jgi:hypothetical protein